MFCSFDLKQTVLHLGEVPGLYTPEELEPLLSSLKDAASQDGFTRPLYDYFSHSECRIMITIIFHICPYFFIYFSMCSSVKHVLNLLSLPIFVTRVISYHNLFLSLILSDSGLLCPRCAAV